MKKYYLMAIEKKYIKSMIYLGCYYKCIEKNYSEFINYLTIAVDLDSTESMFFTWMLLSI